MDTEEVEDRTSNTPMAKAMEMAMEMAMAMEVTPIAIDTASMATLGLTDRNQNGTWTAAAKSAAQRWAREKEAKIGAGVWMWWTDGSRSDDDRVGAAAVCKHGNEWRSRRSFLGTGRMEGFDAELWVIGLAHDLAIENSETL